MDLLFKLKPPLRVKQSNLVIGPEIETLRVAAVGTLPEAI
jgi:hypothetical protein